MKEEHIEIERKYVIRKPCVADMSALSGYSVSEITQIYIESPARITHRVRKRCYPDGEVYTETKKIRIDKISAIEDEREISADEYLEISKRIKKGSTPLTKARHTFSYCDQIFEVDIYPEWESTAIMETELSDRTDEVKMPPFIEIVREVSGDKRYSNASMSESFPDEIV